MRVLVEVISAEFGGIRTYVEHLLDTWERTHPEDELVVVVPRTSTVPTFGHRRVELDVPRPDVVARPLVQTLAVPRLAREYRVDAVLATLPSTTLRHPGVPTAIVVYDLRHELRPEQFGRGRRLLRNVSYGAGYRLADGIVSISQRTLDDLHRLHPSTAGTPSAVTHLGADHVLRWPGAAGGGPAVTFAHHSNKNPTLILDAWATGRDRGATLPPLTMLGVGSARRAAFQAEIDVRHLHDDVTLAPFLPEPAFQALMKSSSLVVFPSDFEGFGLPVVEGMLLGAPVVIGPDPGTLEVAGGHATVLADWTPAALVDAVVTASRVPASAREAAQRHAAAFTWRRCVEQTREFLGGLARRG
ncbi:MAG: glycosyltransferase [Marmoricola sp.]